MTDEKICKNCKYYCEHYVFYSMQFHPIGGHCKYDVRKDFINENYAANKICNHWESDNLKKEKTEKTIQEIFKNIEKQLFHIEKLLSLNKGNGT